MKDNNQNYGTTDKDAETKDNKEAQDALKDAKVAKMEAKYALKNAREDAKKAKKEAKREDARKRARIAAQKYPSMALLFSKYTYQGGIMILFGIVLSMSFKDVINSHVELWVDVFSQLFQTIGIALLIGAVFDFAKNSEGFVKQISDILSKILTSKPFLTDLSEKDKKKALELILRPTQNQELQYPNIDRYFDKHIKNLVKLFDANFRSNLDIRVHVSEVDGKIIAETSMSFRIYKVQNQYKPVEMFVDKLHHSEINKNKTTENKKSSGFKMNEIYIISPADGSSEKIEHNSFVDESGQTKLKNKISFDIPAKYNDQPYLTIRRKYVEYGSDHWLLYTFGVVTPSDGINFTLKCEDDLIIKEVAILDTALHSSIEPFEHDEIYKEIEITSSIWLHMHSGFTIAIAKKEHSENKAPHDKHQSNDAEQNQTTQETNETVTLPFKKEGQKEDQEEKPLSPV